MSRRGRPPAEGRARSRRATSTLLAAVAGLAALLPVAAGPTAPSLAAAVPAANATRATAYPMGVFDLHEPSLLAPPGPHALRGYASVYVDDFGTPLRYPFWNLFGGVPKGDPVGRFERSHVSVRRGLLRLGTWRDPRHHDRWASGGACLCGVHPTYGAYFVRSRQSSIGPDDSEMLWPRSNDWPPEVDFAETGDATWRASWFDHYRPAPSAVQSHGHINVLHWHTWGVVWTPRSLTFVVDGRAWGRVTLRAAVPRVAMTLDLQQQTWCGIYPECPTHPSTLLVDWVEVYRPG
jgi:Glycosyl hydrolases family 16